MKPTLFPVLLGVLSLVGCSEHVEVIVVRGCEANECETMSVSREEFNGDVALWDRASQNGGVLIDNQTEETLYYYETLYGDERNGGTDADTGFEMLESGIHVVEMTPDYIMVQSPDQISSVAGVAQSKWELQCTEGILREFQGMFEE
jgi:hypothetical protein